MTDNLLMKVEEKVMTLVTELETARKEIYHMRSELNHARQENSNLKSEKIGYLEKLQDLVSLLDAVDAMEPVPVDHHANLEVVAAG